ncbi:TrbI/VirB10 family protein [Novosphingobium mathurense]|uniref:Type IV secretion system protein VirB10 n=1 Tax=Novosphingobium mathurense TaxID=428990 RepID=A0A1U6GR99_9SPHN|nr:TrbI/VirB10 family protein [Novosphingobium mathurense]SLJ86028.1 type IV secretion system protein VirB10 [Novosphingobium mathurense]HKY82842.1 TrbI/VirB10 family protein [Sphingobium sp.]
MSEPPVDMAAPDAATQAAPSSTAGTGKVAPEKLVLRAAPRRVVRFRRGVIVGGAAVASLAIAGTAWMALGPKTLQIVPSEDKAITDRRTPADAVANLPGDYSKVTPTTPILGDPLPGDLGKPILDRQRELAAEGAIPSDPAAAPQGMTAAEQAAEAERQRIAAQAHQAREAGVMVQSSGWAAGVSMATGSDGAATASITPATENEQAGHLALDPDRDQNAQQRKLDFIGQQSSSGIYNAHALQTPASPYQIMAGSVIAASLITGLNSDLPGMVVAQVTEPVFDTVTGRILLIPQGSRLIGSYDSVVAFGQSRALLVWQRIILSDGSSIQIDNLPATDAAGYAGLSDKVDFHTWRLLKGVALSTLLGVGTELSLGSDESDLVRAIRQSTQQSANQAGQQIVSRNLNIQPTITVRPGWPLRVIVHKDIQLRPWGDAR